MKKNVAQLFRKYCPEIPMLHKWLQRIKLKEINQYVVPQSDVHSGEESESKQGEIVERYSKLWPEYVQMLNEKLDEYIARCEPVRMREDLTELRKKVLFTCLAYGFMPDEFFAFGLEYKSNEERRSYISNRERDNYIYELNDIIDIDIFWDKYKTYEKFKKYYHREAICIEKQSDYERFDKFIEKHPVFVVKNVRLSKGDSVKLIDSNTCGKTHRQLFDMLISGRGKVYR